MHLNIAENIDELNNQMAEWIVLYIHSVLKKKDRFTIVLSGGETPKKLYQLLSTGKYKNTIAWNKLHFFWGDERCVPFDNDQNNARMAFEILLNHVPVIKKQIHVIPTDIEPQPAAMEYEKTLRECFPDSDHTFDLVLLGMGEDAHTLSLFPGDDTINEKSTWVRTVYLEEKKMYRITLTAAVVNAAARVAFLVSGGSKAAALYHVLSGEYNPMDYPAQIIQPYNGELYWWIDKATAADIT